MPLKNKTITYLTRQNAGAFKSLILPDEYNLIAQGKSVTALGLLDRGTACGALTGYYTDDITFRITSLYIVPDYRRCGGATALIDVVKSLLSYDSVIEISFTFEEDDGLSAFLTYCGFLSFTPENLLYKVRLGDILDSIKPLIRSGEEDAPCFAEYDESVLRFASTIALKNHFPAPPDGFLSKGIDKELSTLLYENGSLEGYLVVDRFAGGELTISGLYTKNNPKHFASLLIGSAMKAREVYERQTTVMLPVISEEGELLLHKLLPDAQLLTVGYALYF